MHCFTRLLTLVDVCGFVLGLSLPDEQRGSAAEGKFCYIYYIHEGLCLWEFSMALPVCVPSGNYVWWHFHCVSQQPCLGVYNRRPACIHKLPLL